MGMFDTFVAHCPCCGEKVTTQSKLFNCNLEEFNPGDRLGDYSNNRDRFTNVEFKTNRHRCSNCGEVLTVCVRNGLFRGFLYDPNE